MVHDKNEQNIYSEALLNGFKPVKRIRSPNCLIIADGSSLAFTRILIECIMALMSFVIVSANKNPEDPNVKLHAIYLNSNVTSLICINMAIKYPIGFFQSNGNLLFEYFVWKMQLKWKKFDRSWLLILTKLTMLELVIEMHHFSHRWCSKWNSLERLLVKPNRERTLWQSENTGFYWFFPPVDWFFHTFSSVMCALILNFNEFLQKFHQNVSPLTFNWVDSLLLMTFWRFSMKIYISDIFETMLMWDMKTKVPPDVIKIESMSFSGVSATQNRYMYCKIRAKILMKMITNCLVLYHFWSAPKCIDAKFSRTVWKIFIGAVLWCDIYTNNFFDYRSGYAIFNSFYQLQSLRPKDSKLII